MKEYIEKIKKLWANKYTKPLLFFGFYIVFFAIIFNLPQHDTKPVNNNENKDVFKYIYNNYEYLYSVRNKDGQVIELEGKKYNNKTLFTKRIDNVIENEYYKFYDNVKIKNNDEWIPYNGLILIDSTFNEQFLDLSYIKQVVNDAELMDTKNNFDGSISEYYKFNNINIEVIGEGISLKRINITLPLYDVVLQYRNINTVQDFVVEK